MTKFEIIVERLKNESFLAGYTFVKSDSSFIQKFEGGWRKIGLDHHSVSSYLTIRPVLLERFDIASKWFEKFSFKTLKDQRSIWTVGASPEMYDCTGYFYFDDPDKFEETYSNLALVLEKCSQKLFNKFKSIQDVYTYNILPIIEANECYNDGGIDWFFEYLIICRIVAKENYDKLKEILLRHADWRMTRNKWPEPNMNYYYHRLDEILGYLESLDLEKMVQSNGKKVIIKE